MNSNKSFSDMLRERRQFVMGQNSPSQAVGGGTPLVPQGGQGLTPGALAKMYMDAYNKKIAFDQNQEDQTQGMADNYLKNGYQGAAANPNDIYGALNGMYTKNEDSTTGLLQLLSGLATNQGSQNIERMNAGTNQYNAQTNRVGTVGGLQNTQHAQGREDFSAGYSPSVSAGASPLISQTADNIMNGTQRLETLNLPQAVKNQIQSELTKRGYDPAEQYNTILKGARANYLNAKSGSLAAGGTMKGPLNQVFSFLHDKTGGAFNPQSQQDIQGYNDLRKSVANSGDPLMKKIAPLLPTTDMSQKQAEDNFNQIQKIIDAQYHKAGGKTATKSQPANPNPLKLKL